MDIHLAPVSAFEDHEFFQLLNATLEQQRSRQATVRAAIAYATLGGVEEFCRQAGSTRGWRLIHKQFLVGLHHAITEPSALESLRGLPHSEVRVYLPNRRLSLATFEDRPVFHPKVFAICTGRRHSLQFAQAGSANMTAAALGRSPSNYEFALAARNHERQRLDPSGVFNRWWSSLWNQARPVDRRLVRDYAELRKRVLDQNPILRTAADVPASIETARYLFVEVGAGSGPPGARHQVEFPEGLVRYFGPPQRGRVDLSLRGGARQWDSRPLSYKTTTYGVEIWRLGMPTQASGGVAIAERVIRFERTGNRGIFGYSVADVGSSTVAGWANAANLRGHLGATHGARRRQYGFY